MLIWKSHQLWQRKAAYWCLPVGMGPNLASPAVSLRPVQDTQMGGIIWALVDRGPSCSLLCQLLSCRLSAPNPLVSQGFLLLGLSLRLGSETSAVASLCPFLRDLHFGSADSTSVFLRLSNPTFSLVLSAVGVVVVSCNCYLHVTWSSFVSSGTSLVTS